MLSVDNAPVRCLIWGILSSMGWQIRFPTWHRPNARQCTDIQLYINRCLRCILGSECHSILSAPTARSSRTTVAKERESHYDRMEIDYHGFKVCEQNIIYGLWNAFNQLQKIGKSASWDTHSCISCHISCSRTLYPRLTKWHPLSKARSSVSQRSYLLYMVSLPRLHQSWDVYCFCGYRNNSRSRPRRICS